MKLDCHLLLCAVVVLALVLVVLVMVGTGVATRLLTRAVPQPALVVRLCPEGPGLDGHHGGCVGVHEAGEGVVGRHGGGGGGLLRGSGYPRRGAPLPGVVVDGVGDELCVELLHPLGLARVGRVLGLPGELRAALGGAGLAGLAGGGGAVLGDRQTPGDTRLAHLGWHVVILASILLTQGNVRQRGKMIQTGTDL